MDYRQAQGNPAKHLTGIGFVILVHVVTVYALATGLGHKLIEVVKGPLETKLIEEVKKAQPDTPPPPPPKLAPPPPSFVPPPEVNIAVAPSSSANTISQVTSKPQPAVEAPPPKRGPIRTEPVIDAKRSCAMPEYPPSSRRLEESGTVTLRFLIDTDGQVVESKIEKSSGFDRLDNAARDALSRCRFKPGAVDGVPEQSWARLNYTWKLKN